MTDDIVEIIRFVKSYNDDLTRVHKPELINGKTAIMDACNHDVNDDKVVNKAYICLKQKQRQVMYRGNLEAQNSAKVKEESLASDNGKPNDQPNIECQKPWNKLSGTIRIQFVNQFIDALVPILTNDQKTQLRYLLISQLTQKKLCKSTDVEYDSVGCHLMAIKGLSYNNGKFVLEEGSTDTCDYKPQYKKKIVIKMKMNS